MNTVRQEETKGWWKSFYETFPLESFTERAETGELEQTLLFLQTVLKLSPGSVVFDQCCGTGEVSIPLSRRGVSIIGVDLCEKFIGIARKRAQDASLSCQYFCGDAFNFVPEQSCDAAFNWWTSFGYSEADSTNKMMLERAFQSLKPGGTFVLDYPNSTGIILNFKPRTYKFYDTAYGGSVVIRETSINLVKGLREQLWTYLIPGAGRRVHQTSIKIYMPNSVVQMLQEAGFEQIDLFGGLHFEPLELSSERCLFVARRPR